MKQTKEKSDKEIIYVLNYLVLFLSGILVYVTEGQRNKRAKFHALQAIFLGVIVFLLSYFPFVNIIALVLWIYGIYIGVRAYDGIDMSIPVIGDYAKRYSG